MSEHATDTYYSSSHAPIRAFITNLGAYNDGELIGKWHNFPTTPEKIQKTFEDIGIDGAQYEEFFVTDYEVDVYSLIDHLPEHASLDELNYLASRMSEMYGPEVQQFEAILEAGEHTGSLQDIINLTYNMDNFEYIPHVNNDDDLGYYWIEDSGAYDLGSMGSLANYIDYEKFGRDIRIEEGGTYVSGGYVRDNGDGFDEEYDGINVPEEYKVFPEADEPEHDGPMTVLLVEPEKHPKVIEIKSGLRPLQEAVGGYIQAVYPFDDPVSIICNEEGKLQGLPLNRALYDDNGKVYDVISGSFLVVGIGGDDFASLSPELLEKYSAHFHHPQQFMKITGEIMAIRCPVKADGMPERVDELKKSCDLER